ncbi:MAG: hypothetical protein MJ196_07945 [Treponemataceae bacterium]|nr:hypothetical protein [Treponemataceae bacterium]
MIYPYMTLPDNTEITHTELKSDGTVTVYIETPDEKDGFHHAQCVLPKYEWSDVFGYSEEQMAEFKDIVESGAHLIIRFAECGGFTNASNF